MVSSVTNGRTITRYLMTGLLVLVALGGTTFGQGRDRREVNDRWNLKLVVGSTDATTDLAAGNTLGVLIRIEDVLDFDESSFGGGIEGFYRFNPEGKGKHRIWFSYGALSRDSSGTIMGTVPIFDEDFTGMFASEYKNTIFQVQYRLSLFKTPKGEAGIIAGLSTFDYEFKLRGEIVGGSGGGSVAEKADFLAPIPTFGIFLTYGIRHNLIFTSSVDSLDIDISDIEGRVLNTAGSLTWYVVKNFGIGIKAGSANVNVTDTGGDPSFKVDYRVNSYGFIISGSF